MEDMTINTEGVKTSDTKMLVAGAAIGVLSVWTVYHAKQWWDRRELRKARETFNETKVSEDS